MKNVAATTIAVGIVILGAWRIQAQQTPATPTNLESPSDVCLSRLRQSALAMQMYTRDNDDRFPPADQWNDLLSPLLPKPVAAVTMTSADSDSPFNCPLLGADGWGYSMNWKLSKRAINEIDSPSTTASIYETNVPRPNAAYDGRDLIFRHTQLDAQGKSEHGGLFAFADGHASWLSAAHKPNFRIFLDNKPRKQN